MRIERGGQCSGARYTVRARIDHDDIARRTTQLLEESFPAVGRSEDVSACPPQHNPKV